MCNKKHANNYFAQPKPNERDLAFPGFWKGRKKHFRKWKKQTDCYL